MAASGGALGDIGSRSLTVERVRLRLRGWKTKPLRVGFFSDIHVNDPDEMMRARRASELLAAESPEIVLFGGDCVNWDSTPSMENISASLEPLAPLTCPKLAVLGNHDYWTGAVDKVEGRLNNAGFRVLKNEMIQLDGYSVAGYDDRMSGLRDPAFQPQAESLIVLMHEPDDVGVVPNTAALQISGHSHGGQICLPFGMILYTPSLAKVYRSGFYPNAHVPLYVSRGVGTVGPKWRAFCPPEVTILTLEGGAE